MEISTTGQALAGRPVYWPGDGVDVQSPGPALQGSPFNDDTAPKTGCQKWLPAFDPDRVWVRAWHVWTTSAVLYAAAATPFIVFFNVRLDAGGSWWAWEVVIYATFAMDVLINLNLAYVGGDGNLITSRWEIFKHYARTWMVVDLLAVLPLQYENLDGNSQDENLTRFLRLPRLFQLLRLLRVARAMGSLNRLLQRMHTHVNGAYATIAVNMFLCILFVHVMTCLWWWQGIDSMRRGLPSWIPSYGISEDQDLSTAYIVSMYYILCTATTLGPGDITPKNNFERVYAAFIMSFGGVGLALFAAIIARLMAQASEEESMLRKKRTQLAAFIAQQRIPPSLEKRLMSAFEAAVAASGDDTQTVSIREVLPLIAPELRQDAWLWVRRKVLAGLPALQSQAPPVQSFVLENMEHHKALPGEVLAAEESAADCMFWLLSGSVVLTKDGYTLATYGPGAYFGEIDCVYAPSRIGTLIALSTCEYYTLPRDALHELCETSEAFSAFLLSVAAVRVVRYEACLPAGQSLEVAAVVRQAAPPSASAIPGSNTADASPMVGGAVALPIPGMLKRNGSATDSYNSFVSMGTNPKGGSAIFAVGRTPALGGVSGGNIASMTSVTDGKPKGALGPTSPNSRVKASIRRASLIAADRAALQRGLISPQALAAAAGGGVTAPQQTGQNSAGVPTAMDSAGAPAGTAQAAGTPHLRATGTTPRLTGVAGPGTATGVGQSTRALVAPGTPNWGARSVDAHGNALPKAAGSLRLATAQQTGAGVAAAGSLSDPAQVGGARSGGVGGPDGGMDGFSLDNSSSSAAGANNNAAGDNGPSHAVGIDEDERDGRGRAGSSDSRAGTAGTAGGRTVRGGSADGASSPMGSGTPHTSALNTRNAPPTLHASVSGFVPQGSAGSSTTPSHPQSTVVNLGAVMRGAFWGHTKGQPSAGSQRAPGQYGGLMGSGALSAPSPRLSGADGFAAQATRVQEVSKMQPSQAVQAQHGHIDPLSLAERVQGSVQGLRMLLGDAVARLGEGGSIGRLGSTRALARPAGSFTNLSQLSGLGSSTGTVGRTIGGGGYGSMLGALRATNPGKNSRGSFTSGGSFNGAPGPMPVGGMAGAAAVTSPGGFVTPVPGGPHASVGSFRGMATGGGSAGPINGYQASIGRASTNMPGPFPVAPPHIQAPAHWERYGHAGQMHAHFGGVPEGGDDGDASPAGVELQAVPGPQGGLRREASDLANVGPTGQTPRHSPPASGMDRQWSARMSSASQNTAFGGTMSGVPGGRGTAGRTTLGSSTVDNNNTLRLLGNLAGAHAEAEEEAKKASRRGAPLSTIFAQLQAEGGGSGSNTPVPGQAGGGSPVVRQADGQQVQDWPRRSNLGQGRMAAGLPPLPPSAGTGASGEASMAVSRHASYGPGQMPSRLSGIIEPEGSQPSSSPVDTSSGQGTSGDTSPVEEGGHASGRSEAVGPWASAWPGPGGSEP